MTTVHLIRSWITLCLISLVWTVLSAGMAPPVAQAQTYPTCTALASDPDGDGWGWENNQSCQIAKASNGYPYCTAGHYQTSTSAGWGWEANRSCVIPTTSPSPVITYPVCTALASDPDGDGWGWENNKSCQVAKASNGYPYCTAGHYQLSSSAGWGWEASRSCVIPAGMVTTPPTVTPVTAVTPPADVIVARTGSLYSASGQKLVLRGINLQYGDAPSVRLAGINAIAATGANAVRLELRNATTAAELTAALDAIVAKNMVAVLMYWEGDVTCQSYTQGFDRAMDRWLNTWKPVLSNAKYRRHLILNIANEWGEPDSADTYGTTYRAAITKLRAAGYAFPLMIDAAHCGQNFSVLTNGGAARIAGADKYRNIVFSVHAYWSYQTGPLIEAAATAVRASGYPFVWGEFGQLAFQPGQATDHRYLMQMSNRDGLGYLAWSWKGNGTWDNQTVLDMSSSEGLVSVSAATPYGLQLTTYGLQVVNGTTIGTTVVPGLRATSVVFKP
jgi:mannan endo-1,4-beta-mannosidase